MQGLQRLEVIHPEDRQTSLTAWEQAFATGNPYEVELRLQGADGQYRWFLNRAVPIRDGAGQVVKWFGTSTDLDEVKRTEENKRLVEVQARLLAEEKRLRQEQRASRLGRWLLATVSATLIASGSLGFLAWVQSRQVTLREEEAQQLLGEVSARITRHLDTYLETAHAANQRHIAALEAGAISLDNLDALHRYLILQLMRTDAATTFVFGTPQGDLRVIHRVNPDDRGLNTWLRPEELLFEAAISERSTPLVNRIYSIDEAGNRVRNIMTIRNIDVRERPWFRLAVETGKPGWTAPFQIGSTDLLAINAYAPVYDDNQQLQAVFGVNLSVRYLNEFLESLSIGQSGLAFIIERDGLLVANSVGESSYRSDKPRRLPNQPQPAFTKPGQVAFQRLSATESDNAIVRVATQQLQSQLGDFDAIQVAQELEVDIAGQQHFLRVIPYSDDYGLDWLIITVVPRADLQAQVYADAKRILLPTGLVVLVVIGVVLWLARRG